MTRRNRLLWTALLAFFVACSLAGVMAWFILLTTICSSPRTPAPETHHVIAYNCHGMTVYISHFQNAMLHGLLVPFEALFILLSIVAAVVVFLALGNARIEVQIHGADLFGGGPPGGMDALRIRVFAVPPGEAPAWVREKWVGLELPLAQRSSEPATRSIAGVLSGPRNSFAMLADLARGRAQRRSGFKVNVLQAIAVLEQASPEAAQWWRAHTPHLMKPSRCFLFPEHVCGVVRP